MTLPELLESNPNPISANEAFPYWDTVFHQAITHTRRRLVDEANRIVYSVRPNEPENIKDYRQSNERQITKEGFDIFISKVTRIIKNSNVKLRSLSDELQEWLATKPFRFLGESLTLEGFALDCILRQALESPNDLVVVFPINPDNVDIAPANLESDGGLPSNKPIGIEVKIVHYNEIGYVDDDVLIFIGGQMMVQKGDAIVEEDFYYAADPEMWYWLEPVYRKNENGSFVLVYEVHDWYRHETGQTLVNFLPGEKAKSIDNETLYQESFIKAYYEYSDETVAAFSDNQAVRVRYNFPFVATSVSACYNPDCVDGYIDGKRDATKTNYNKCPVCMGSNEVSMPGPHGTMVRKSKKGLTGSQTDSNSETPLMEFYHPEVSILQESYKVPFDLHQRAKQSIGLDLLDGTGNESGTAKDLRLEDLHDKLSRIAEGLYGVVQKMLTQAEALLKPTASEREEPNIVLPQSFAIKNLPMLKEEAATAISEDRIQARLNYYQNKYRGDDGLIRIYEIALLYSPLMSMELDEIQLRLGAGVYDKNDIIKRDHVIKALHSIKEDEDLIEMKNENAFELIDRWFEDNGLLAEEEEQPLFGGEAPQDTEPTGEEIPEDLDETEEILTALLNERIGRPEAVSLLARVEGISEDEAEQVIKETGL